LDCTGDIDYLKIYEKRLFHDPDAFAYG